MMPGNGGAAAFNAPQRLDYNPKLSFTATASSCSEPR